MKSQEPRISVAKKVLAKSLFRQLTTNDSAVSIALIGDHGSGKSYTIKHLMRQFQHAREFTSRPTLQTHTRFLFRLAKLTFKKSRSLKRFLKLGKLLATRPVASSSLVIPVVIQTWLPNAKSMNAEVIASINTYLKEADVERNRLLTRPERRQLRTFCLQNTGTLAFDQTITFSERKAPLTLATILLFAVLCAKTIEEFSKLLTDKTILNPLKQSITSGASTILNISSISRQSPLHLISSLIAIALLFLGIQWISFSYRTQRSPDQSFPSYLAQTLRLHLSLLHTSHQSTITATQIDERQLVTHLTTLLSINKHLKIVLILEDFDRLSSEERAAHWSLLDLLKRQNRIYPGNARIKLVATLTPSLIHSASSSKEDLFQRLFESFAYLPEPLNSDNRRFIERTLPPEHLNAALVDQMLDTIKYVFADEVVTFRILERMIQNAANLQELHNSVIPFDACFMASALNQKGIRDISSWHDLGTKPLSAASNTQQSIRTRQIHLTELLYGLLSDHNAGTLTDRAKLFLSDQNSLDESGLQLEALASEIAYVFIESDTERKKHLASFVSSDNFERFIQALGSAQKASFFNTISAEPETLASEAAMRNALPLIRTEPVIFDQLHSSYSSFVKQEINAQKDLGSGVIKALLLISSESMHTTFEANEALFWKLLRYERTTTGEFSAFDILRQVLPRQFSTEMKDAFELRNKISLPLTKIDNEEFAYFVSSLKRFEVELPNEWRRELIPLFKGSFLFLENLIPSSREGSTLHDLFNTREPIVPPSTAEVASENNGIIRKPLYQLLLDSVYSIQDNNRTAIEVSCACLLGLLSSDEFLHELSTATERFADYQFWAPFLTSSKDVNLSGRIDIVLTILLLKPDVDLDILVANEINLLSKIDSSRRVLSLFAERAPTSFSYFLATSLGRMTLSQDAAQIRMLYFANLVSESSTLRHRILGEIPSFAKEAQFEFAIIWIKNFFARSSESITTEEFKACAVHCAALLYRNENALASTLKNELLMLFESQAVDSWMNLFLGMQAGARGREIDSLLIQMKGMIIERGAVYNGFQAALERLSERHHRESLRTVLTVFSPSLQGEFTKLFFIDIQ